MKHKQHKKHESLPWTWIEFDNRLNYFNELLNMINNDTMQDIVFAGCSNQINSNEHVDMYRYYGLTKIKETIERNILMIVYKQPCKKWLKKRSKLC